MKLILAPLHGFTDSTFRNAYFRHFRGFDEVMAPFISLTHGDKITSLKTRDVQPALNASVSLIPQILGNDAKEFILLSRYLSDELGYHEVNWNLGCPINGIVKKKRGSGLLPYPEMVDQLLSEIIPQLSMELSIKLRLGLRTVEEFPPLVQVLNQYPLKNITIHPRLGIQQYEGKVLLDELDGLLPFMRHRVVYNGDIHSFSDFQAISKRYPSITDFMLGRGVFYNPFLPEMVRESKAELPVNSRDRFVDFYRDLEESVHRSRKMWMSKMKEYWKYFSMFLGLNDTDAIRILRCKTEADWEILISETLGNKNT